MTKSKIFLWVLVSFIAGIAVRSFIALPYVLAWVFVMVGAIEFAVGVRRIEKKFALGGLFLIAFVAGALRFDVVDHRGPALPSQFGHTSLVRGIVADDPVVSEASQRMKIKVVSLGDYAAEPPFFMIATARRMPAYRIGDELEITGEIERPENFSDFDYVSYLRRDGIGAVMSFPDIHKIGEGKGNPVVLALSRLKHAFEEKIDAALPEPHAGFLKGLLLGERSMLPDNITTDFQIAGVGHIVALSGYNITIVGRSLMDVLLLFTVPFTVSFWVAIAGITLFIAMTGAAASTVRAGIMGVLLLVAEREGRMYRMTNALVFAAAAMIAYNPYLLRFDAGFQLSFLATVGILYLAPRLEYRMGGADGSGFTRKPAGGRIISRIRKTLAETLSAQIMVLPLIISLFGRVSLISPVANILILAAVPYAMAVGFAAGMLGFVWPLASIVVGWGAWALLEYQLRVVAFLARVPFASVAAGAWIVAPLLALYMIVLLRLYKKAKQKG